jgi:glycolate oxidase iron-sulfur subunit
MNKRLLGVLPDDDVLSQCIHCGMCLATCPTYEVTKMERSSPRGRIRMIKAVARGEMEITETFAEEMSFCLDCQACETACPAGVKYGSMVEAARVEIDNSDAGGSKLSKAIKKFALQSVVAKKGNLRTAAMLLKFYQRSGLEKFLMKSGILKAVAPKLSEIAKLAPKVSKRFSDKLVKKVTPAKGEEKYRAVFLSGCLMGVMFADINKDTVELLSKCGCKTITPGDQGCCGSLHAHNGDYDTAKKLAKHNLDVFDKYEFDYMISNSAGCGAYMKEYGHLFEDDPEYREKGKKFSAKVKDVMEFLAEAKPEFMTDELKEEITYHDACHLAHTQKVVNEPRVVLKSVKGIKYSELEESSWCCGSAGIYNVVRYDDSMKFLERKMENIKKSGADLVLAGNPGCLTQIEYGAEKFGVKVKVKHPVTYLNEKI